MSIQRLDTITYFKPINEVNFRTSPSVNSDVLKILKPKDSLTVIDSIENWYKIKNNEDLVGFVSKRFIEKKVEIIEIEETPKKDKFIESSNVIYLSFSLLIIISMIIILFQRNRIKKLKTKISNFRPIKELDKELKSLTEKRNNLSSIYQEENSKLIKEYNKKKEILTEFENRKTTVESLKNEIEILFKKSEKLNNEYNTKNESLKNEYLNKKSSLENEFLYGKEIYNDLKEQISLYKSENNYIENGIYEPIFDFGISESYKVKLLENIKEQKKLIKNKTACFSKTEWTVNGSKREGTKSTNRNIKLTLRAFNGECDSLISKVKWNNINNIEKRILKSFEMINKFNEVSTIEISQSFLDLKIEELKINHEYNLKKQEEKEELRKARALIREEEKARRDYERALKETEEEQRIYNKALEKAKKELGIVEGKELLKLQDKIKSLENDLIISKQKSERALSMAQQTKRGHVYVVSNLGSFGKDVYKIGMTRRLDPLDRVKELGDASVPFLFDKHAMIFTNDAPKLESVLHQKFNDRRVNKVNFRKEYFNVTIEEIEICINENFEGEFEIIKDIEAKEFRETEYIIENEKHIEFKKKEELGNEYPDSLFK